MALYCLTKSQSPTGGAPKFQASTYNAMGGGGGGEGGLSRVSRACFSLQERGKEEQPTSNDLSTSVLTYLEVGIAKGEDRGNELGEGGAQGMARDTDHLELRVLVDLVLQLAHQVHDGLEEALVEAAVQARGRHVLGVRVA